MRSSTRLLFAERLGSEDFAVQAEPARNLASDGFEAAWAQLIGRRVLPLAGPGGCLTEATRNINRCGRRIAKADQRQLGKPGRVVPCAASPAILPQPYSRAARTIS